MPRVNSLNANVQVITAIANDISFDECFVYQLRTLAQAGDILVTISSSGDSENVVRAAQWARENDVDVISMTGFTGGRTGDLANIHLSVKGDNYGVVEDTHQSIMHILAQYLRQDRMDETTIQNRKF
jgi:phosphoheptose isomerase